MSQAPFVQPPRIAVWLVDLFTPSEQAESIPGDLLEEFSEQASKSGVAHARGWYWRQSLKTAAHLIVTRFRVAPWLIAAAMIVGCLVWFASFWCTEKAIFAILPRYGGQIYAHIGAYEFWLLYGILIHRLVEPFLGGCIVAVTAKSREMVATMTLGLIIGAMELAHLVQTRQYWSTPNFNFQWLPLLVATFVSPVMIVIGGVIVRGIRSSMSRRPSTIHC